MRELLRKPKVKFLKFFSLEDFFILIFYFKSNKDVKSGETLPINSQDHSAIESHNNYFTNDSIANQNQSSTEKIANYDPFCKAAKNITKMLVTINFFCIYVNLTVAVTHCLMFLFNKNSPFTILFSVYSSIILYMSHSINIFIYYRYDKLFFELFNKTFFKKINKSKPNQKK